MKMDPGKFLSAEEERALLKLARKALQEYVNCKSVYQIKEELPETLKQKAACFVTYKIGEELRGCIGSIYPELPLCQEVVQRAIDASVHDPRFAPVSPKEIDQISIEISVLSPIQEIDSPSCFEPGKHGVILSKKGRMAVYLPQVAAEQGWDREETLSHLSMKAGLSAEDWKSETKFQVFTAQIFSEAKK